MIVRQIDDEGDWTFGKGANDYLRGVPAVGQCILTRLKSFLGDCFFDTEAGIDWFNLLGSHNQIALDFNIRTTILNSPLVASLTVLGSNLDRRTRLYSPSYKVFTLVAKTPFDNSQLFINNLLTELGDVLTTESGDPIGV